MNPKHGLKRAIKGIWENVELDGWNRDIFEIVKELFDYVQTLEERIDKLEEK